MIRWCSYCQAFLGDHPPHDDPSLSHGICPSCADQFARGDELVDMTWRVRDLMNRIFACASRADASAIPALIEEARAGGLSPASMLVGFIQPALYRAGQAWQEGCMSVVEEHRFTLWCERFFAQLPACRPAATPLDLLILLAPSNTHSLGARFAAELLEARGISTRVVVPEIPVADAVKEIERLRPAVVGLSCALASCLPEADAVVTELRARIEPSWKGTFVLAGLALRGPNASWTSAAGAVVAVTLDDAERVVLTSRRSCQVAATSGDVPA
ncbi:MAG: cobalamin-dependent protein [Polyangiaceae bacterium]